MPPKTRGQSQKEVEKNKDSDLAQGTPRKKAPPSKSGVSTRTYVSALETNSDPSEGQSTGDITQLDHWENQYKSRAQLRNRIEIVR